MRLQPIRWTQLLVATLLMMPVPSPAAEAPIVDRTRADTATTISRDQLEQLPTGRTYRDVVDAARPYKENPKDSINWEALRGDRTDAPIPGGVSMEAIQQSPVIYQREWPGEAMGMNGPLIVEGKIGTQDAVGVYSPTGAPMYFETMKAIKADPAPLEQAIQDAYGMGGGFLPDAGTSPAGAAGKPPKGTASGSITRPDGSTEHVEHRPDGTATRTIRDPNGNVVSSTPIDNTPTTVPPRERGTSGSTTDANGNTVTYKKNPDGSTTRTVTTPDGRQLSSGPVEQPPVTKPKPRAGGDSASTTDANGNTVTYKKNPDGSTTRTVTTPDGRVIDSQPVEPPPVTKPKLREGGDSASTTDENGNTVKVEKQKDGSKVKTVTAPDGTVLLKEPVNPPPVTKPNPKSGISSASFIRDDGLLETINLNKDGTRTHIVSDPATGRPIAANPLLPAEQAHQAAALAQQQQQTAVQTGGPTLKPAKDKTGGSAKKDGAKKDGGAKDGKPATEPGAPVPSPAVSDAPIESVLDDLENPAGPTHTEPKGEPTIRTTGDGTLVRTYPDGTTEYTGTDGGQFVRYGDDTTFQRFPDGTTVQRNPDGTETHRNPDGTITKQTGATVVNLGPSGSGQPRGDAAKYLQGQQPQTQNVAPGGGTTPAPTPQPNTTKTPTGQPPQQPPAPQGSGTGTQPTIIGDPEKIKKQSPEVQRALQQYLTLEGQNQTQPQTEKPFTPIIQSGYDLQGLMERYYNQGFVSPDGTSGLDWEAIQRYAGDFKNFGGSMQQLDPPAVANDLPAGSLPAALDYGMGSKWGLGYGLTPKLDLGLNYNYDYGQATAPIDSVLDDIGPESYRPGSGFHYIPGTDTALKAGGQSTGQTYQGDAVRAGGHGLYGGPHPLAGKMEEGRRGGPHLPSFGKDIGLRRRQLIRLSDSPTMKPMIRSGGLRLPPKPRFGSHYYGKWEEEDDAIMDDYYDDGGKGYPISSNYHGVTFMEPPTLWQPNRIRMIQYGLPDEEGYRDIADAVLTIQDGKWVMDITYYVEDLIDLTWWALPPNDPLYFKGEEAAAKAARKAKEEKRPKLDMSLAAPLGMEGESPAVLKRKEPVIKAVDQWGLRAVGFTPDKDSAWKIASGEKPNTIVAVIDSGLDAGHPDAPEHLWTNEDEVPGNGVDDDGNGYVDDVHGWNFVQESNDLTDQWGHGTHVAGIIAAKRDNGAGIAGINPGARIMVLKVGDDTHLPTSLALYRAIHYAADQGARVMNISMGNPGRSRLVQLAVNYAHLRGAVVVVASGNANSDIGTYGPAGLRRVLSVGALNMEGGRHALSNFGANTALLAPGEDIYSLHSRQAEWHGPAADRERLYRPATGTSFAAPIVAATASLMFAADPKRSNREVEAVLLNTAKDLDREGWDPMTGWGLLDARAALQADPARALVVFPTEVVVSRNGKKVGAVDVYGVIAGALQGYEVSLGEGRAPASWSPIAQGTRTVRFGLLCHLDGDRLKGSKVWTIRITATDAQGARRSADVPVTF